MSSTCLTKFPMLVYATVVTHSQQHCSSSLMGMELAVLFLFSKREIPQILKAFLI